MLSKVSDFANALLLLYLAAIGTCRAETCQSNNDPATTSSGRQCSPASCKSPENKEKCFEAEDCVCDYECGWSCIDKASPCPPPPEIPNLSRIEVTRKDGNSSRVPVYGQPYVYDDQLEYVCAPGYRLDLEVKHLCDGFRKWTYPNASKCVRACIRDAVAVKQKRLQCGKTCLTDDDCATAEKKQLSCLCDRACGRTCVDPNVDCGEAEPTGNCSIEYLGEGIHRIAHYVCDEGFYLYSGSASRKCTGAGNYDGVLPICSKIECGDPFVSIAVSNKEIPDHVPGPYLVGTNLTFSCPSNHQLYGDRVRTCQGNGLWSGTPVVCDVIDDKQRCAYPGIPVNGRLLTAIGDFRVGSSVEFACNCGYLLVGEKRQKCGSDLQWNGRKAPKCFNSRHADKSLPWVDFLLDDIRQLNSISDEGGEAIAEVYLLIDVSNTFAAGENLFEESIQFLITLLKQLTERYRFGIVVFGAKAEVANDSNHIAINNTQAISILRDVKKNQEILREKLGQKSNLLSALSFYEKMTKVSNENIFRKVYLTINGEIEKIKQEGINQVINNKTNLSKELMQLTMIVTCNDCKRSLENVDDYIDHFVTSPKRIILNRDSYALPLILEKGKVLMTSNSTSKIAPRVRNNTTMLTSAETCQPNNDPATTSSGRQCSPASCKSPENKENCFEAEDCVCDYECGLSCINRASPCPPPPEIPNLSRIEVTRKDGNSSRVPVYGQPYVYDDQLEYVCAPGYRLDLEVKHLCDGFGKWTYPNASKCVLACGIRDAVAVKQKRLQCGKTCLTDDDCATAEKKQLSCLCDRACGRTCVDPNVDCGEAEPTGNCSIEYLGEGIHRIAHYVCDEGFYLYSGSASRKCTGAGNYDGVLPICSKIECGDPFLSIAVSNKEIPDHVPGPYLVGTNLTFSCPSNHQLCGDRVRTCQGNGLWSGTPVACDVIDDKQRCAYPGIPVNGRLLTAIGDFRVGSSVEFACNCGYLLVGEKRQKCGSDLQWSGRKAPKCFNSRHADKSLPWVDFLLDDIRQLNSISDEGGKAIAEVYLLIDVSNTFGAGENLFEESIQFLITLLKQLTERYRFGIVVFGAKAEVANDSNHIAINSTQAISILRDVKKNQEILREKLGQKSNLLSALSFYEKMTKVSNENIFRKVYLTINGEIEKIKQEGINQVINNKTNLSKELMQLTMIVTCNDCKGSLENVDDYIDHFVTSPKRIILNRDSYALPLILEKGKVLMTSNSTSKIAPTVRNNTTMLTSVVSTFNVTSTDLDCGEAEPAGNCSIEYLGEGIHRIAHYVCDVGFYLYSGSASRKCTGAGIYGGVLPICLRVECGDPFLSFLPLLPEIPNYVSGPYFVGTNLTFSCPSTHRLLGDMTRTCQENGLWSGTPVVCDVIDQLTRCAYPGNPINGRLLTPRGGFKVESRVEFECDCGYLLVGEKIQECLHYLKWNGRHAPKCFDARYADRSMPGVDTLLADIQVLNTIGSDEGKVAEIYLLIDVSNTYVDGENMFDASIQFLINFLKQLDKQYLFGIVAFGTNAELVRDIKQPAINSSQAISILQDMDQENLRRKLGVKGDVRNAILFFEKLVEKSKMAHKDVIRKVFVTFNGMMKPNTTREVANGGSGTFKDLSQISVIISCEDCRRSLENVIDYIGDLVCVSSDRIILNRDSNALTRILEKRRASLTRDFALPPEELNQCGTSGGFSDIARTSLLEAKVTPRVLGGQPAKVGRWPWQVVVARQTKPLEIRRRTFGGGSVISNSWILTAAHLFNDSCESKDQTKSKKFHVIMGTQHLDVSLEDFTNSGSNIRVFEPAVIYCHENFKSVFNGYDIALIKLGRELMTSGNEFVPRGSSSGWVTFNPNIRPVCLPCSEDGCIRDDQSCGEQGSNTASAKNALHIVTGFGHTTTLADSSVSSDVVISEVLQEGVVRLRDREECSRAAEHRNQSFTEQMVCALGHEQGRVVDACKADSGGPLVREVVNDASTKSTWMQVGVVSFGFGCGLNYPQNGMEHPYPGYYTDVYSFLPWLRSTMKNENCTCPRNTTTIEKEGRICTPSCLLDQDCSAPDEICVCDNACGKSCVNPGMTCEKLSPFINGQRVGNTTFNSTVNYTCDIGFALTGDSSQTCRLDQKWSGSVPSCEASEKSCFVVGDPHYTTFDRHFFDFQGICSYAMVRYLNKSSPDWFVVEVDNEHRASNSLVAWLRKVNIKLKDKTVELDKGRVVKIDGTVVNLPVYNIETVKSIRLNGRFVELQTTLGLRVLYDGDTYLKVAISSKLFGKVEGLCGDADGDSKNDFKDLQSNNIFNDSNLFAVQYQTATKNPCSSGQPIKKVPCPPENVSIFSQNCSILSDKNGCFANCHKKVQPQEFLQNCITDACANDDAITAIDNHVGAYAQLCQSFGVDICPEWRQQTGTEIVCPENSHYSPCSSTCPPTCVERRNVTCTDPCLEGCDCNEGFVYSGDACVPGSQCGCLYKDRYYKDKESLMSSLCDEICVCENNSMTCEYHRCNEREFCGKDLNGMNACVPIGYAVSAVWGDPHYRLFDRSGWFDFMGVCSYYLSKTPRLDRFDPRWFEIISQNEHRYGNTMVSYLKDITINLKGGALVVKLEKDGVARINGEVVLGYTSDEFSVQPTGHAWVIISKYGLEVFFNGYEARINISTVYWKEVHGLCGNFNGNKSDDLEMSSGEQAKSFREMAESYTTGSCSAESTKLSVCSPSDELKWSSESFCGSLTKQNGTFSACHGVIDADKFFNKCLFDVCATQGNRQVFKEALEAYAGECQKNGIALCNWQRLLNMDNLTCPEHSHYEGCASPCTDTCQSPYATSNCVISGHAAACVCDPGYIRNGDVCVRRTQCGCIIDGSYVTKSGHVYVRSSNQDCTCLGVGRVDCSCSKQPFGGACFGWSSWGQWGSCNARCGELGAMMRTRMCPEGKCPISNKQERVCNGMRCPTSRGVLSFWGPWLSCSATCESAGSQVRLRICIGASCQGLLVDSKVCIGESCSIEWSEWGTWGKCLGKCDEVGARVRIRDCPGGGCSKEATEDRQRCFGPPCPVWSQWTRWLGCSASCNGQGVENRERKCKRGPCQGPTKEERPCFGPFCESGWSDWAPWSLCSASVCEQKGIKNRSRDCLGNFICAGLSNETKPCVGPPCPPVWRDWTPWSACSGNCESLLGTRERSRSCISGSCRVHGTQTVRESCQAICVSIWSDWTTWSVCSGKCEYSGTQHRARQCLQGLCIGPKTDRRACVGSYCPRALVDIVDQTSLLPTNATSLVSTSTTTFPNTNTETNKSGWSQWSTWTVCPPGCCPHENILKRDRKRSTASVQDPSTIETEVLWSCDSREDSNEP